MSRHRGRGRGGNGGGKHNSNINNGSPRGGHAGGTRVSKRGGGRHQQHNHHHHHNNERRWVWHNDHYQSDAESVVTSSETDTTDHDFIDPRHYPKAENNIFSILLPPSPRAPGKPACRLPACKRAKRDLNQIQQQTRRLRRSLRRALEHSGPELWDFLCEGENEYDDDVESMDWVPEPTVNLIVAATLSPEPTPSPQASLGIHCGVSSSSQEQQQQQQQQKQQQQQSSPMICAGEPASPGSISCIQGHQPTSQAGSDSSFIPILGLSTIRNNQAHPGEGQGHECVVV